MKLDFIKEEFKNHIENFVANDAKEAAVLWMKDTALPAVREVADSYTAALKSSAVRESGWCKFRDSVFLPCAVNVSLWFIGKALNKMAAKQGE